MTPLRCYLVGTESLLVYCGQHLLDAGHKVLGVASADAAVASWAESHGIATLPLDGDLTRRLAAEPFDYLLSIANLHVLPASAVALAVRGGVNFHDGPLPRYAGLQAPTWALLNREAQHGITWHLMQGGVDEGEVLLQETFPISEGETALTLNAKCYEAGIRTFPALVRLLEADTLISRPQDLSARTYFGAFARPAGACALHLDRDAEDVAAFVRAVDFGGYANPIGVPYVVTSGGVLYVTEVQILSSRHGARAGTVLSVTEELEVATATNDVCLRGLKTADGFALTARAAAERLRIATGDVVSTPPPATIERLTALHTKLARHEPYWSERLGARRPLDLPYIPSERLRRRTDRLEMTDPSPAPEIVGVLDDVDAGERLLTVLVAWCAQIARTPLLDVGLSLPGLREQASGVTDWCSPTVPLRVDLPLDAPAANACRVVHAAVADADKHVGFLKNLVARRAGARDSRRERLRWPIRFSLGDRLPDEPNLEDRDAALSIHLTRAGRAWRWIYDPDAISFEAIEQMRRQVVTFAEHLLETPAQPLESVSSISRAETTRLVESWNATSTPYPHDRCIHEVIGEQVARTPAAIAVVDRQRSLTFAELDARANVLATRLMAAGAGPETVVGVSVDRSVDLVVSLLGILKAGAAYVPLDVEYPAERLAFMLQDSGARLLVTERHVDDRFPHSAERIFVDDLPDGAGATEAPVSPVRSENLAYVIYTSGSTGQPKGVMISHRNVLNFFAAMDERLGHDREGVWLAVTSLSFDISVLELLWALSRGFKVVVHSGADHAAVRRTEGASSRPVGFSLFYFASDESQDPGDRYRLLTDGAMFADAHGFEAVWTPERHFHAFGGLYPNPAVAGAALAMITRSVHIRAGSVVLPLHHPARVAEEWAVVDNLSKGRVGISVASGWQPDDFLLNPSAYRDAKKTMLDNLEIVRRLWRGETVPFEGPRGEVRVRTLPRPIQPELPVWITSAGNPETFRMAGEAGGYVLTHLLGQTLEELDSKLRVYRDAWRAAGHPGDGRVTLMLHTFVGDDSTNVRDIVREPMKRYLASSVSLIKSVASSFPAFKHAATTTPAEVDTLFASLSPEELDALTEHAFNRYYETGGLFGNVVECERIVARLQAIGVDEVACLIDFGVEVDTALRGLQALDRLRQRVQAASQASDDYSIAAAMERHQVTHLQCTPSLATMLVDDSRSRESLGRLSRLLVGGEALSPRLAQRLVEAVGGVVQNMYGPTETTVWSLSQTLDPHDSRVAIGRPIANTVCFVLDERQSLVPIGSTGELFIGGDGVARGYWGRPELTAERFVRNPFDPESRTRLYRTGDLVRYRPDGVLEFLGRIDHQVKVRGHRIELGEIENALRQLPGVRDAVVIRREDTPDDVRLVGYVRVDEGAAKGVGDLRESLRARLPAHAVPSHVVRLSEWPLTPNGKVDRKAFPPPEAVRERAPVRPPETEGERILAGIWADLLRLPAVGVDDNFFDLGGHSLLAVQALGRLRESGSSAVTITDLFRFPTIRTLARHMAGNAAPSPLLTEAQSRASKRLALRRGTAVV